jgi:hypothetical protein
MWALRNISLKIFGNSIEAVLVVNALACHRADGEKPWVHERLLQKMQVRQNM